LRAVDGYDNILNKLAVASTATSDVAASIPTEFSVPTSELSIPHVFLADIGSGGDLPLIPIVLGAIAMLAGVFLLAKDGDKTESTTSPTEAVLPPPPSSIGSCDLSMPYGAFKEKYEADAVADVKAKQKKPAGSTTIDSSDLSIPYDAAARLAYFKSDKSMAYDVFKTKYEADAVADVKAKQKK
jgi:hypothetical protein